MMFRFLFPRSMRTLNHKVDYRHDNSEPRMVESEYSSSSSSNDNNNKKVTPSPTMTSSSQSRPRRHAKIPTGTMNVSVAGFRIQLVRKASVTEKPLFPGNVTPFLKKEEVCQR